MDSGDAEECDLDCDFIRKPKSYHHSPKFKSSASGVTESSTKRLSLTPCNKVSPVERLPLESYINPFTPDGKVIADKVKAQTKFKRLSLNEALPRFNLNDSMECENVVQTDSEFDIPSRPRLKELSVSRFNEEFIVLEEIGKGVYGCVCKCLNRINGCIYAVKRSLKPIQSDIQERFVRNEIYAHGVLIHQNLVRNYSCWNEDCFVFIQNEYCNMGNLEDYIKSNVMTETQLCNLLMQISYALDYMHKKGLAHMDIKPSNIFLKSENSEDSNVRDDDKANSIIYKLGDLGHVTSLDEENDIEEGDCRYLSREILQGNLKHLDKGDVFSLGLTVYEASGGGALPKNGDEWHEIRNGNLKYFNNLSKNFNDIMKAMIRPQPEKRPSAAEVVKMLKSNSSSSVLEDDLRFLFQYRHLNTRLEHEVGITGHYLRELYKSHQQLQDQFGNGAESFRRDMLPFTGKRKEGCTNSRIVGKKTKRSNSTMF